ncbi:TIGR01244 family sulfur transferase [Eleftheria terrae]|uniref:TIGR01244 family sulfur transferase n=1 Tax=Eleftheria terrae TaxID=1597781 RepID=UPI00263B3DDB|nr:TIGR01244 family sulfur transferase [Eleftheria terrae]WKB53977.1 TIGR01244 family sulfur transferase [Eleftheria terrae]
MSLPIQQLSSEVCVAPQLEPAAMQAAAEAGFKSVINNRPDHEGGPTQPTSEQMEAAAKAAGLQYVHLPVSPSVQTPEEIARFAELLETLPKPVLAFCRSGGRCTRLFQAATATRG